MKDPSRNWASKSPDRLSSPCAPDHVSLGAMSRTWRATERREADRASHLPHSYSHSQGRSIISREPMQSDFDPPSFRVVQITQSLAVSIYTGRQSGFSSERAKRRTSIIAPITQAHRWGCMCMSDPCYRHTLEIND